MMRLVDTRDMYAPFRVMEYLSRHKESVSHAQIERLQRTSVSLDDWYYPCRSWTLERAALVFYHPF